MVFRWNSSPRSAVGLRPARRRGHRFSARSLAWLAACLWLALGLVSSAAWGENGGPMVDPKLFGLDLPPGLVEPGNDRRVTTSDDAGALVVARLHVLVGENAVVLLPDGQLCIRKRDEFSITDRKFEPIAREELAKSLAKEFAGFQIQQSKHYTYVSQTREEFLIGTKGILETMVNGVIKHVKTLGLDVHPPDLPLVVVMFASEEEFQKHRRVPAGTTAYYHPLSNRVYLYEPRELAEQSRDLAISQATSTIAHEGAHQILHNIGVQQRLSIWPTWLCEGLAEYFAPTSFGKNLRWKGPGLVNDLRMYELQQYLKQRSDPPDGRMIEQTVAAAQLNSTGYASAWALTHFLAKTKKAEFGRCLREASKLGPLEGAAAAPLDLERVKRFQSYFGDNLADLEARLIAHIRRQDFKDPFLELPHFMAMIAFPEGKTLRRQAKVFHSSLEADRWAQNIIAALPVEVQQRVFRDVKRFDHRAAAEQFLKSWLRQ